MHHYKKISYTKLLTSILTFVICGLLFTMICQRATAIGGAGTGGSASGGHENCKGGTGSILGSCNGGGWTYHRTDSNHVVIPGRNGSSFNFPGGVVEGCGDVGGYFLNSWFRNGSTEDLVGIAENRQWSAVSDPLDPNYWQGDHRYNSQAIDLGYIRTKYDEAISLGVPVQPGTRWETVGWFCADVDDVPVTPNPTPGGTPPATASTEFKSRSGVKVGPEEITGGKEFKSAEDSTVEAYFSTDKSSVTVEFFHEINYYHGSFTMGARDTVAGDTVSSKWEVRDNGDGASYSSAGKVGAWKPDQDHSQKGIAVHSVTINFGDEYPDQPKQVCSEIKYEKNVTLTSRYICDSRDQNGNCTSGHYEWSSSVSGEGKSSACVKVDRPRPPEGDITANGGGSAEDGGTTNKIMFAGETTPMSWDVRAKDIYTRRLVTKRPIIFQVNEFPGYNSSIKNNVPSTKTDPCGLYRDQYFSGSTKYCEPYQEQTFDTKNNYTPKSENETKFDHRNYFKVPEYVGDKYCNSFGYNFQYWYGEKQGGGSIAWTHDAPKDYWFDFSASCRTIAKKPNTAAWNGSIMSTGSLISSLSPRYDTVNPGEIASGSQTLYGSWSEYLAIAKTWPNNGKTMASGSTLSTGSSQLSICDSKPWESNSPLSISNFSTNTDACDLRASNITANSTFLTRLNAYFNDEKNIANIKTVGSINDLYGTLSGNKLLRVRGSDLTIEQDIKVDGNYNLHNLPQAVIIVDGGNVNIANNVKRVDAWLIVTSSGGRGGTINTCHYDGQDFQPGRDTGVQSDTYNTLVSPCTEQLAFNGPVIANRVNLQRSYGANNHTRHRTNAYDNSNGIGNKETPAEIFNLRADAYIWGYAQASRYNSSYSEAYSRELAPRY